jgi:hypothetical protein
MKQQTNQNNGQETTRTDRQTRARIHIKGIQAHNDDKNQRNTYIYIYQESDVVTGVDDANLCVLVGGCIR